MKSNKARENQKPQREGDVLGISNAVPGPGVPRPRPGHGHPGGIDVREGATGIDELHQSSGATGIDMGAAGEGTGVAEHSSRPLSAQRGPASGEKDK